MKFQGSKLEIEAPESKTYILHCKMYVFSILEWNFKVPNLKLKPQSQKHTFYTVKCMFFNFGMKFQGSKLEIEAPESKTYILHCKMYVFSILEWNFKVPNLKLKPESQKHTFYTIKCMFLAQGLFLKKHVWIMPIVWKHTFYTVKCMFFTILEWYFKIPRLKLKPQSQKHTFYTVKCMFFSILEWNFKIPSLKLKLQSQKHTFFTVKCMFFFNFGMKFQGSNPEIEAPQSKTYILHGKMYVFPR